MSRAQNVYNIADNHARTVQVCIDRLHELGANKQLNRLTGRLQELAVRATRETMTRHYGRSARSLARVCAATELGHATAAPLSSVSPQEHGVGSLSAHIQAAASGSNDAPAARLYQLAPQAALVSPTALLYGLDWSCRGRHAALAAVGDYCAGVVCLSCRYRPTNRNPSAARGAHDACDGAWLNDGFGCGHTASSQEVVDWEEAHIS